MEEEDIHLGREKWKLGWEGMIGRSEPWEDRGRRWRIKRVKEEKAIFIEREREATGGDDMRREGWDFGWIIIDGSVT